MARKKQQQKKRLKKYQGKYVTANRLDMSKGGRVKAQVGGKFAKAPVDSKKTPTMSIEREEEVKPTVQPKETTQPIKQAPVESKIPNDVVQTGTNTNITPQETFIENVDTAANNINTTFTKAPEQVKKPNIIEPKGPTSEEFITNTTTRFNVGDTRTLPNGKILEWDGKTWITL